MKKDLLKLTSLISLTAFYPITVSAQGFFSICFGLNGLNGILCRIHELLNSIIPVLVALGVVYFVWGVVQYFIRDDEEAKKKGKDRIIYGIIGLTVIISVWGLVGIVVNTFGTEEVAPSNSYLQDLLPSN